MAIQTITAAEFERLAPLVAANQAFMKAHPDCISRPYPEIGNDETGKVEQYRLLNDPPETIYAYLGKANRNGMGIDRVIGQTYPVTVWTGQPIGYATLGSSWRVRSFIGSTMGQYYATIAGREYTGRGFGEGMCITLRETADSRRKRATQGSK